MVVFLSASKSSEMNFSRLDEGGQDQRARKGFVKCALTIDKFDLMAEVRSRGDRLLAQVVEVERELPIAIEDRGYKVPIVLPW